MLSEYSPIDQLRAAEERLEKLEFKAQEIQSARYFVTAIAEDSFTSEKITRMLNRSAALLQCAIDEQRLQMRKPEQVLARCQAEAAAYRRAQTASKGGAR